MLEKLGAQNLKVRQMACVRQEGPTEFPGVNVTMSRARAGFVRRGLQGEELESSRAGAVEEGRADAGECVVTKTRATAS